jgi:hypothetical protein
MLIYAYLFIYSGKMIKYIQFDIFFITSIQSISSVFAIEPLSLLRTPIAQGKGLMLLNYICEGFIKTLVIAPMGSEFIFMPPSEYYEESTLKVLSTGKALKLVPFYYILNFIPTQVII